MFFHDLVVILVPCVIIVVLVRLWLSSSQYDVYLSRLGATFICVMAYLCEGDSNQQSISDQQQ